jgi:hypothetical protein
MVELIGIEPMIAESKSADLPLVDSSTNKENYATSISKMSIRFLLNYFRLPIFRRSRLLGGA